MRNYPALSVGLLGFCVGMLALATTAHSDVPSRVLLNGVPTPVAFNDGDSFKVLAGPHAHTRARLAGFNTLESYGPVHLWGDWTARELYYLAKKGTMNARKGKWNCTSDLSRDGYGRILWFCLDLAVDQVRKGYAHAMTVTADPAHPDIVKAQQEAIANKAGIWAHGVPDFVMTSLHSSTEGYAKGPMNRLVSSKDGHSEKWKHDFAFRECQMVCEPSPDVDKTRIAGLATELRAVDELKEGLVAFDDATLLAVVTEFIETGVINGSLKDEGMRYPLEKHLGRAAASGKYRTSQKPVSCQYYVAFERRYRETKAHCLKIN